MRFLIPFSLFVAPTFAFAAAGDQTLSVGYTQIHSSGLKRYYNDVANIYGDISNIAGFYGDQKSSLDIDNYKQPEGMFIRYRYEYDNRFGIVGSLSYAVQDNNINTSNVYSRFGVNYEDAYKNNISSNYFSALIGPSYRLNSYFSFLAIAGISYKSVDTKIKAFSYENDRVVSSGSYSVSEHKFSPAYSLGAQVNVYQGLVIDAAYEASSGGSQWKTSGFTIGIGYKF